MPRYIDANKIKLTGLTFSDVNNEVYFGLSDVRKAIEQTPTADVVEVVRCKDCKYWVYEDDLGMFCSHWGSTLAESQADDFCSYGERKHNETVQ